MRSYFAILLLGVAAVVARADIDWLDLGGLDPTIRAVFQDQLVRIKDAEALDDLNLRIDAWMSFAILLQANHLTEGAIRAYSEVLELHAISDALYLRGIARDELGQVDEAIVDYQLAIHNGRNDAMIFYRLGRSLYLNGRAPAAVDPLTNALQLAPNSPAIEMALADVFVSINRDEDALKLLLSAWERQPEAGQIAFRLGEIYRRRGDRESQLLWLSRRNERAPTVVDSLLAYVGDHSLNPAFFVSSGQKAWRRGDFEDALSAYESALRMDPDRHDVRLDYANMLIERKLMDEARTEINQVVESWSHTVRSYFLLGRSWQDTDKSKAIEAFELSLAQGESVDSRLQLAKLYLLTAQFDAAEMNLEELIHTHEDDAYLHYWKSIVHARQYRCPSALIAIGDALRARPTWGEAHILRARLEAICGDANASYDRVRQLRKIAISPEVQITWGLCLLKTHRKHDARLVFEEYATDADAMYFLSFLDNPDSKMLPFAPDSKSWNPQL